MTLERNTDGILKFDGVELVHIAEEFATPCYIYSRKHLEQQWQSFDDAFGEHPHLTCFAVKANSNLAVLNVLAHLDSGFDIVSGGELERVLAAGGDAAKTVFSGVGKSRTEISRALEVGIRCFNVESRSELLMINKIAEEKGVVAPISIRINPDIDANTHPYISTGLRTSKFGIDIEHAKDVYQTAHELANVRIEGVDCHIGSQLTSMLPFLDTLECLLKLIDELAEAGIEIKHLNLGGGLGIRYQEEVPPTPQEYVEAILEKLGSRDLELIIEPGRSIAANAGILLTQVRYLKHRPPQHFAIVDAAMNDLARPVLYDAWHRIEPVVRQATEENVYSYDIVGPVCETGDFLGLQRELSLNESDLLAILGAGAYGFTMSSNYNTRTRAAEVMISNGKPQLIRQRENVSDLFANEFLINDLSVSV